MLLENTNTGNEILYPQLEKIQDTVLSLLRLEIHRPLFFEGNDMAPTDETLG